MFYDIFFDNLDQFIVAKEYRPTQKGRELVLQALRETKGEDRLIWDAIAFLSASFDVHDASFQGLTVQEMAEKFMMLAFDKYVAYYLSEYEHLAWEAWDRKHIIFDPVDDHGWADPRELH